MLVLTGRPLTLPEIERIAGGGGFSIAPEAREKMCASRATIERIVASGRSVYGVNTGFGKLSDVHIAEDRLEELQYNLVRSHACGLGEPLSEPEVRVMMALRANVLALGFSGARPEVADQLAALDAAGVVPVVPSRGSVGASGDLAPLAHLALALIGEGRCALKGRELEGEEALAQAGIAPLRLQAKEGLALLNGTQALTAVGALALARARRVAEAATVAGAMTLEALKGTPAAFDERIHAARPHPGQIEVAARLRRLLADSEIRESHRVNDPRVQDAYSLRCMPQVHGAALDAIRHAETVVEIETGAATDNPLVFAETGEVVSGGNFHGAPVGLALDFAAIALADLMSISERRIDRLVNPDSSEGLPAFLATEPGTSSGFMIAHVAAVALLAEARVLAHPASPDNAPTSGGKEDHVSMGMTAALKLRSMVELAERVAAIELVAAAEGLEHRRPLRAGAGVERAYREVRSAVGRLERDRALADDFESVARMVRAGRFSEDA